MAPQPGGLIRAFDIMAGRIVDKLHDLFGFQYSRNAEHYIYHTSVASGTADGVGTTYNTSIRVTQEADFVATRLNGTCRISTGTGIGNVIGISAAAAAAGDLPDFPAALQIIDGSTDRQLHSQAVDVFGMYGTFGGLPGIWARPRLFARNSTISLTLSSYKAVPASTAWTYRLGLIGWKIYDAKALDLTSRA